MKRPIAFVVVMLIVAAYSGTASPSVSLAPPTAAAVQTSPPATASPPASASPSFAPPAFAPGNTAPRTPPPFALLPALPAGSLDAKTAAALQMVLDNLVTQGAPDAIASVITADGQWSGAAGVDGPDGRAADPADEFSVAHISYTFLAATILRLAQDGKIDLDAPLPTYLGNLTVDANGATVRQALGMRSGIGNTPADFVAKVRADCGRIWTRAEVMALIPAPKAEPGTIVDQSNPAYKLLAAAAEHVTGAALGTAIHDIVLAPVSADRILLQLPTQPAPKP